MVEVPASSALGAPTLKAAIPAAARVESLGASAGERLAPVLVALALLWAGVYWALR